MFEFGTLRLSTQSSHLMYGSDRSTSVSSNKISVKSPLTPIIHHQRKSTTSHSTPAINGTCHSTAARECQEVQITLTRLNSIIRDQKTTAGKSLLMASQPTEPARLFIQGAMIHSKSMNGIKPEYHKVTTGIAPQFGTTLGCVSATLQGLPLTGC